MISRKDLLYLARFRLKDARILKRNRQYSTAVYLCGYSVELALKARIVKKLGWTGFPETNREFEGKRDIKTHDFDVLMNYTGLEKIIKAQYLIQWSQAKTWSPESRYKPNRSVSANDAKKMIDATRILVEVISK